MYKIKSRSRSSKRKNNNNIKRHLIGGNDEEIINQYVMNYINSLQSLSNADKNKYYNQIKAIIFSATQDNKRFKPEFSNYR
jgi:hypothetical protein